MSCEDTANCSPLKRWRVVVIDEFYCDATDREQAEQLYIDRPDGSSVMHMEVEPV